MYLDKEGGTSTQPTQVVNICVWVDKILKTNIELMSAKSMQQLTEQVLL